LIEVVIGLAMVWAPFWRGIPVFRLKAMTSDSKSLRTPRQRIQSGRSGTYL